MDVYDEWSDAFRRGLKDAGFERAPENDGREIWVGLLEVGWDDPLDGTRRLATHRVKILLPQGFPCTRPIASQVDEPPIRGNRHQAPGNEYGSLCLWPPLDAGAGWMPWTETEAYIERVREWFVHYYRDDWSPRDRPPDLHQYFDAEEPRPLMLVGDDWVPSADTRSGRFGIWQRNKQRAFAGAPTGGLALPPRRHTDRLLREIYLADQDFSQVGLWIRLNREPTPRPTLAAMLEEIDKAAGQAAGWALSTIRTVIGARIGKGGQSFIMGLGYPDPQDATGPERWLFLRAQIGSRDHKTSVVTSELSKVKIESFEAAPAGREALLRRTGHIAARLAGKHVTVFGLGAIGSSLTVLLAKAGVPGLALVDSARLRPGNAVRHAAGLEYVGWAKTEATRDVILSHTPDCNVTSRPTTWDPGRLKDWIGGEDLIVDATANPAFSLLLNRLCLQLGRPAIYVTAHRHASIGRVRLVRPGQDACLLCYLHHQHDGVCPIIPEGPEREFVEEGCGTPTVQASAVDIEAVANQAARVGLWQLRDVQGPSNHWLVVNEPLPDSDIVFQTVGLHESHWGRAAVCGGCSAFVPVA